MTDKLTTKQENFCLAYLETGNASEAYRRAYDAQNMKPEAIWTEASVLLKHPLVAPRIDALKAKAERKAVLSKAWVIERLMKNAKIALGEEPVRLKMRIKDDVEEVEVSQRDAAAANKALELLGKYYELRMWVEQVETGDPNDFSKLTDDELRERARQEAIDLGIIDDPSTAADSKSS